MIETITVPFVTAIIYPNTDRNRPAHSAILSDPITDILPWNSRNIERLPHRGYMNSLPDNRIYWALLPPVSAVPTEFDVAIVKYWPIQPLRLARDPVEPAENLDGFFVDRDNGGFSLFEPAKLLRINKVLLAAPLWAGDDAAYNNWLSTYWDQTGATIVDSLPGRDIIWTDQIPFFASTKIDKMVEWRLCLCRQLQVLLN